MLSTHSCAASSFHSCTLSMSSPPGSSARTRAYEATLPGPTNQHRSGWSRRFVPSSGSPPSLVQPRKEPRHGVRIGGKPGGGWGAGLEPPAGRSEEHTSELQSRSDLVCRLLLEKKKKQTAQ